MVRPNHSVATKSRSAAVETLVRVDLVAIIAALALLDHAVATGRRLAVVAGVGGVVVSIVTAFTGADDAITAASFDASAQACVTVVIVAIITGLKVLIIFAQAVAHHAIAAARSETTVAACISVD